MADDTENDDDSASAPGVLHKIAPKELGAVIAQARDERWTDLALAGPMMRRGLTTRVWPKELRGRTVFELMEPTGEGSWHLPFGSVQKSLANNLSTLQTLGNLRSLTLWRLNLGTSEAKAIATNLNQLTSLSLSGNNLDDEAAAAIASNLKLLQSLNVGHNRIGPEGSRAIANGLEQLTSLDLSLNGVGAEGAIAIASNLRRLTSLDLSGNRIGVEGAAAIASNLKQLTSLSLGFNGVGAEGARAIALNLRQLEFLSLWNNRIGGEGAKAIASNLTRLTTLDLANNAVDAEGAKEIARNLKQLTSLNLAINRVDDEGAAAIGEGVVLLQRLDLANNKNIKSLAWNRMPSGLRSLNLTRTEVADLSPLKALVETGVPIRLGEQQPDDSEGIYVEGCPLVRPTPEIVRQGREAVLNYFRETERQGVDHLYEAKVLLVGEGGAGKTSLLRRLYNPEQPLPAEDKSTRGIDVHVRHFDRPGGGKFRLNIWDFGGQQIYHATHQIFLTKSSLYVLVDDTRKDHKSVHDEGFKYWLEVVEAFGDKSPVLIFQNEKGGRSKAIDEAGIKGRFPNVLQTLKGNLGQQDAADGIRQAIEQLVQGLPHVGQAVPAKWVTIRAEIEEVAKQRPTISLDEYLNIYDKHLERDRDKALLLSHYLHDIGVFLHFQDDLRLGKTVIVQNHWATEAVFRVLDDERIKVRLGYFDRADCARLWAGPDYADMHMELLALMEKFELCYQLPRTER